MWVSQGGKCPQTGKIIPQTEINDHTKWAADHIFPYAKGGTTTLDNGQLVCKVWNESKGAKLMSELKVA
jgi:CRISPR/Cas system Type II protein with McrA/HNH and RuvC-like nuclease domain